MNLDKIINQSLSYTEYRNFVNQLITEGKTTGNTQSEKLLEFTKLNAQRMNRLDKTIQLDENVIKQLQSSHSKYWQWLLIGDAWCGDCAQIIPILNKIVISSNDKIKLNIISRDSYPELIENYSVNRSKSIPKLLVINDNTKEVVHTWGPRPKPAQAIMLNWKANNNTISWENFEKELHLWYAKDKGANTIDELVKLMEICGNKISIQQLKLLKV